MSRIHKSLLSNGIKVITEEMPDSESSSIGIWVMTGSRNEGPRTNGLSHFIEHMLFKGTKKRSALDISLEIESAGGVLNAFTGREYTCFYAKVLNRDMVKAVDLLSDIYMNSVFDQGEIEKEKSVVLQEIKLVEDTPDDIIHDLFAERFWNGHALGRPVLGSADIIKSVRKKDCLKYFKSRYRPNGVFVTSAGGARHSSIVRLLDPLMGKTSRHSDSAVGAAPLPKTGVWLYGKDLEQVHMCAGVPMPPQTHHDRYKAYLLNTIFGGGMSSRLFQEIREKRGLAYSVYSYLNLFRDAGALTVYAGTSRQGFKETLGLIIGEFEKLKSKGVTRAELKNAKSQLKGGMLLGLESSDSRMTKLAKDEIYFKRAVSVREIIKNIDSVTVEDMKDTARRFCLPEKLAIVATGKVKEKDLPQGLKAKLL